MENNQQKLFESVIRFKNSKNWFYSCFDSTSRQFKQKQGEYNNLITKNNRILLYKDKDYN